MPLSYTPKGATEFGLVVAGILDDIWALYNIDSRRQIDFTKTDRVEVLIGRDLSTYDFDELTQLVIRCHDACVRLSVNPCNMRYLKLIFSPRTLRTGGDIWNRHPTIEQAVERVRAFNYFTKRSVSA